MDVALMGVALMDVALMGVALMDVALMGVALRRGYHRRLISIIVKIGTAVERAKGYMRYADRRNL
jgi:hypothetical protein